MRVQVICKSLVIEYIEKQLQRNNIQKAIIASYFFDLGENNISTVVKVAEKGVKLGLVNEVRRMLKPFPHGVWWSATGESPPTLVDRKKLFEKMIQKTDNPILKSLLRDRVKIIENDIERDLKRDEEFLNPKF
jgi:GH24 family phage-related lysozyme (muramidase)